MFNKQSCLYWLSGFFFFPAGLHLLRYSMGWDLVVNGVEVPMSCSLIAIPVTLSLSLFLYWYAKRR